MRREVRAPDFDGPTQTEFPVEVVRIVNSPSRWLRKEIAHMARRPTRSLAASQVKLADDAGNTWHATSKRPYWLSEVLEVGKTLEDEDLLMSTSKLPAPIASIEATDLDPR